MSKARAVVFAYHDVGVRCLKVLLSGGVEVPLVVTEDDPHETRGFESVADGRAITDLRWSRPRTPRSGAAGARRRGSRRISCSRFITASMLPAPSSHAARRGALNMHGSLLPKYRGRAPVNWAILNGERETGATLHYMVARADAGDIVDQLAVPILEDDDAREVFAKVTVAAETILARSLEPLVHGRAPRRPQPLEPGQYFGRRRPEDGRIDWHWPARQIHDLVRAVAPPFPGAFARVGAEQWQIHRTRLTGTLAAGGAAPRLYGEQGQCLVVCGDGQVLRLLAGADARGPLDLERRARELESRPLVLG